MADGILSEYDDFVKKKVVISKDEGLVIGLDEINPILKDHQKLIVQWMIRGGRRACFAAFGLGKSVIQLETVRIVREHVGGLALIVIPLGVRQEFTRDAAMLGIETKFIRRIEEVTNESTIYLTNYETIRDGKLDPQLFAVASLDEASILRGFGGSKTFREFMATFAGDRKTMDSRVKTVGTPFRFVATATPSPNEYIELLAYAAFLGVMDVSAAKTRFFKRDSVKADNLTIHPHKEKEFWLWVASWALFVQKPSDIGCSDDGYTMPEMDVRWHEVEADHENAGHEVYGQARMFKAEAIGVVESSREKRESLPARMAKLMELREEYPDHHRIIWHDLERERYAIEKAIPTVVSVFGNQDLELREENIIKFSNGEFQELAAKPSIAGSGCNFQRHCNWAIFLGIGFKFNDFCQAVHRIQRFLQTKTVRIDIIFTSAEREVKRQLVRKWEQHNAMVEKMTQIMKEYGLSQSAMAHTLTRVLGVERAQVKGKSYTAIHNDCVKETAMMDENSVGLILTSIPFSTQYEYSPNYSDFGHTDNNEHFFAQMDFLTPNLLKILKPGRICAVHVKDRIVPGGMTGLGFQTVYPLHCKTIEHYVKHGFGYMGMKTIVTDVVRENNQTYRLGWTEQCKDGTKMGVGMPEYLLLFRKPPTSTEKSYADHPVVKSKQDYTRGRWQIDAHGFSRSSGERFLTPDELAKIPHADMFKAYRRFSLDSIYDFEHHVSLNDGLAEHGQLPVTFMLLQPQSWHPDVYTDITRMLTLNTSQSARNKEMHLCLARDSRVLTKERGYVAIQDVVAGENVLTHKGRWKPVLIVKNTGIQHVVTVKAQGVPGLTLTPGHKLWSRKSEWQRAIDGAKAVDPAWLEAQNALGAYLNLKVPESSETDGDETLWWTVGRWLADGHISGRGDAVISCGSDKWVEFESRIGRFGGNAPHYGSAIQLQLRDPGRELRSILGRCGRGAGYKQLPPEAYTLPIKQAEALLNGYLAGDGHMVPGRGNWIATSISRDLLLGFSLIVQRVYGQIASIYAGRPERECVIDGRTVHAQQEWGMSFSTSISRKKPFILDDGAWKRVRSITDSGEAETWCLKVADDESFTAEGCIVKNCPMQFDLADRVIEQFSEKNDVVFDPFGGLMTVPYRAVLKGRYGMATELSASYFADGCGYLAAAEREMSIPSLFDFMDICHDSESEADELGAA